MKQKNNRYQEAVKFLLEMEKRGLTLNDLIHIISTLENVLEFQEETHATSPTLNNLTQELKKSLDKKEFNKHITNILLDLGFRMSLSGFEYLRTAITMVYEDPEFLHAITKWLYPDIAKIYGKTSSKVERAIRHAIESAWNNPNIEMFYHYFGNSISYDKGRPTNSEFLATIVDYLRRENL